MATPTPSATRLVGVAVAFRQADFIMDDGNLQREVKDDMVKKL